MISQKMYDCVVICDECNEAITFAWDVQFVSGMLICDDCLPKFCLRPHPVDNHFCLCYAGHETDHECCRKHMFY